MGDSSDQRKIYVDCPSDVPNPGALCDALIGAVTDAAPGAVVQNADPNIALEGNDLSLSLHLARVAKDGIGGHLEWRTAQTPTPTSGPRVDFDVVDTAMSAKFYPKFVKGLLRSAPELFEH